MVHSQTITDRFSEGRYPRTCWVVQLSTHSSRSALGSTRVSRLLCRRLCLPTFSVGTVRKKQQRPPLVCHHRALCCPSGAGGRGVVISGCFMYLCAFQLLKYQIIRMSKAESLQEQSEAPQRGLVTWDRHRQTLVCPMLGNEKAEMTGRVLMRRRGRPASFPFCPAVLSHRVHSQAQGRRENASSCFYCLDAGTRTHVRTDAQQDRSKHNIGFRRGLGSPNPLAHFMVKGTVQLKQLWCPNFPSLSFLFLEQLKKNSNNNRIFSEWVKEKIARHANISIFRPMKALLQKPAMDRYIRHSRQMRGLEPFNLFCETK